MCKISAPDSLKKLTFCEYVGTPTAYAQLTVIERQVAEEPVIFGWFGVQAETQVHAEEHACPIGHACEASQVAPHFPTAHTGAATPQPPKDALQAGA